MGAFIGIRKVGTSPSAANGLWTVGASGNALYAQLTSSYSKQSRYVFQYYYITSTKPTLVPTQTVANQSWVYIDTGSGASGSDYVNVQAVFQDTGPGQYTITAISDPANGGTVQVSGASAGSTSSNNFDYGDHCQLTAAPNQGYAFDGWYEGGVNISTEPTYLLTVYSNRTFVAKFTSVDTYTLTTRADPSDGGTVKSGDAAAGSTSTKTGIVSGTSVEVKATPAAGYVFNRWSDGGAQTHSVTITQDTTIVAYFTKTLYRVLGKSDPQDGGTVKVGQVGYFSEAYDYFLYRQSCTIDAKPNIDEGYIFIGWYEGSNLISSSATYTWYVQREINLTAKFSLPTNPRTLTVVSKVYDGSKVCGYIRINTRSSSVHDSLTVQYGTTHTLKALPFSETGLSGVYYVFLYWKRTSPSSSTTYSDNPLSVTVYQDETWEAAFGVRISASASPQSYGSVSISPSPSNGVLEYGTSYSLAARPSRDRYAFDRFYDGSANYTDNPLAQTATKDTTWIAYFKVAYTGLLVNSSDRSSPVQLVYYPATNLLVADY